MYIQNIFFKHHFQSGGFDFRQNFESSGWTASFEATQNAFIQPATPPQPVTSANQSPASQGSHSASMTADTVANSASGDTARKIFTD